MRTTIAMERPMKIAKYLAFLSLACAACSGGGADLEESILLDPSLRLEEGAEVLNPISPIETTASCSMPRTANLPC